MSITASAWSALKRLDIIGGGTDAHLPPLILNLHLYNTTKEEGHYWITISDSFIFSPAFSIFTAFSLT